MLIIGAPTARCLPGQAAGPPPDLYVVGPPPPSMTQRMCAICHQLLVLLIHPALRCSPEQADNQGPPLEPHVAGPPPPDLCAAGPPPN
jgi:hypothetical protein